MGAGPCADLELTTPVAGDTACARQVGRRRRRGGWPGGGAADLHGLSYLARRNADDQHREPAVEPAPVRVTGGRAPPLYYVLLHGWMKLFGASDLAARSLSGLFSIATLPLAWAAGRRAAGPAGARAALLLLSTSPFAVYYATEARMYALVMLLVFAGYLLLQRALTRPSLARLWPVTVIAGHFPSRRRTLSLGTAVPTCRSAQPWAALVDNSSPTAGPCNARAPPTPPALYGDSRSPSAGPRTRIRTPPLPICNRLRSNPGLPSRERPAVSVFLRARWGRRSGAAPWFGYSRPTA